MTINNKDNSVDFLESFSSVDIVNKSYTRSVGM